MKVSLRISQDLYIEIHRDLSVPHRFAAERVGFLACGVAAASNGAIMLFGDSYHPVADDHYLDDPTVGAMLGSNAIRNALQLAYSLRVSMIHIHRHEHDGPPRFSPVDTRENAKLIPDFFKAQPNKPHGAVVLSHDSMAGRCWLPQHQSPVAIAEFQIVGPRTPCLRTFA